MEVIKQPWPWYIAGPLIGLTVPVLLLLGNKKFGISSSLRHICAACFPANISFFHYDWKKEIWNLYFVAGITIGGFLGSHLISNPESILLNPDTVKELSALNVKDYNLLMPSDIFSWPELFTVRGFVCIVFGGFLVGFGTRYAGGCTSGHSILGLSNLQWPSLIATICFMIGGIVMTHLLFPFILTR